MNQKESMIIVTLDLKRQCDYSDAYTPVISTTTVPNTAAAGAAVNNSNKKIIFNNCGPFTDYISEINNTQVDDAPKK